MNHPSKLNAGNPVSRNWRTTNASIDVGRDLDRRVWNLEIQSTRAMDSHSDWIPLVPALLVPGYTPANDGSDGRKFYVPYILLNGVRVKGTLEADGSMGTEEDAPTVVEMPADAQNFVVFISGMFRDYGAFRGWTFGSNHCNKVVHFTDEGGSPKAPEIKFGEVSDGDLDGWDLYPCQPDTIAGAAIGGGSEVASSAYARYVDQPFRFPLARVQPDTVNGGIKFAFNGEERMDVSYRVTGWGREDDGSLIWWMLDPLFIFSKYVEEQAVDNTDCATDCPEFPIDPGSGIGTDNSVPGAVDANNPFTFDQKMRLAGDWLYRVYRPAQGIGTAYDVDNWKTVAMQDGWLWLGGDTPNVVSWGGEVLSGGETEEDPFIIALKVEFSNLTGIGGAPTFTPSIVAGVGQTTDADLNTESKTPDGWPTGCTVEELDNGTIYLPIAHVFFEGQKMIIKEIHRDQASILLELLGGDDGATTSEGLEVPMHHIALICGRVQKEIATTGLLDDTAFTLKQVVGDMQVTLDSSASPTLHYKVQKKMMSQCYYRGWLAYQKLDDEWTDPSQTIDGWQCMEEA